MRYSLASLCLALILCTVANAQVQVMDASGKPLSGVSLQDLAGSGKLVTIKLIEKFDFARDRNLTVKSVNESEGTLTLERAGGGIIAYKLADIRDLRVQDSRLTEKIYTRREGGSLTADQVNIVNRAERRAKELFDAARDDQTMRMEVASLLAVRGDHEAIAYLESLSRTDDLGVAISASLNLYYAGQEPDKDLIFRGLASGQRAVRTQAAKLAGRTHDPQFRKKVRELLDDATVDDFPTIAHGASLLQDPKAVPILAKALKSLHQIQINGALNSLSRMGGKEVESAMLKLVENSEDHVRIRALLVLYRVGDPDTTKKEAADIFKNEYMDSAVYGVWAALALAPSGDWDAQERLRTFYHEPHDNNLENLGQRAAFAAALFEGGYAQAKSMLRDLLNTQEDTIYAKGQTQNEYFKQGTVAATKLVVCYFIAKNGSRTLLSLLDAPMQDSNPYIAYGACAAAIAISDAEFRSRLFE